VPDLPESLTGRTAFLLRLALTRAEAMGELALREIGVAGREYGLLELLGHRSVVNCTSTAPHARPC
jgi:hypothetical protein